MAMGSDRVKGLGTLPATSMGVLLLSGVRLE